MSEYDKTLMILESVFTLIKLLKQKEKLTKEEEDLLVICQAIYDASICGFDVYKQYCQAYAKLFSNNCPITDEGLLINFRLTELPNPNRIEKPKEKPMKKVKQQHKLVKPKQTTVRTYPEDDTPKCAVLPKPPIKQRSVKKDTYREDVLEEALAFGSGMYAAGMDPLALIFKK